MFIPVQSEQSGETNENIYRTENMTSSEQNICSKGTEEKEGAGMQLIFFITANDEIENQRHGKQH